MTEHASEFLTVTTTDEGLVVEPEYLTYLRGQGYRIREVIETHSVPSTSKEVFIHFLVKIVTYRYPIGHPKLDIEDPEQRVTLTICDCGDFTHRQSADVSNPNTTPEDCEECPHCKMV